MRSDRDTKTILVADDEAEVRGYLDTVLRCQGYGVETAQDGMEVLSFLRSSESQVSAVLLDLIMPRKDGMDTLRQIRSYNAELPVIVISGASSPTNVVEAMRNGATGFLEKPVNHDELRKALTQAIERSLEPPQLAHDRAKTSPTDAFIGTSQPIKAIQELVRRIGRSEAPVLIQGETGAGKEVLARIIHSHSLRAHKPILKLNCAALPSELVESELFGYERGAFTGAFQKKLGMFELADGGTIMLDEIGDMDYKLQAKLLQVLQDHEFQRLGGKETTRVDVRVIAATHNDLESAIQLGKFREDLFYRLNVVNLRMPALRERKEDIVPLAEFFLRKYGDSQTVPVLTPSLKYALLAHDWPGNVRELENAMRKLLVLGSQEALTEELNRRASTKSVPKVTPPPPVAVAPLTQGATPVLEQVTKAKEHAEIEAILNALNYTHWNRKQAAVLLKIDYKALLYKIKKLGIDKHSKRVSAIAKSVPEPIACHNEFAV